MERIEPFQDAFKVKAWQQELKANQVQIQSVREIYTRRGKDGNVLHSLINLDAQGPDGNRLAPLCFIKGDAVSIVVVLIDEESNDKFVLLVRQRRICNGSLTYEHPAGMIEDDEKPLDVAVRELKEETGFEISPDEVVPLGSKPWFSATSTSDEALYFFYCERRMPYEAIRAIDGKQTGEAAENEHTRLQVATFPEAHKLISNLHGIMGHFLYLQAVGDYETMQGLSV
ncbi:NUDIX hydrolase [Larkinella rosea]|uniref:GDP-mannose pyrophosphatase n=1 Tax=Larkinella rosea TaxID=2025312 RepID=A0A3P1C7Y9_9BACT|nr:NUDIX hydrolase [Larkinella rosea]RRB09358.1 NUDIX hydrolase [Larkinella rosea]